MKTLMPLFTLLGALFMFASAFAAPGRTTYQARIIKPDGLPLEASNVSFRFTILDPSASCALYVEDYTAVNMAGGAGLISFTLGLGTRTFPVSGTSSTFSNTFDNSIATFNCQTTGTYSPVSDDNRKIVMQFNDGNGWQTLPAMAINSVPYAMYANKSDNSIRLNGKADSAFVEYSTLTALSCAADQAIKFNGVSFSCITVTGGGGGVTSVTTSGTVLSTGGTASAPVISIAAASFTQGGYLTSLDYTEFKGKLSASATQITNTLGFAPVSAAAVTTQINSSSLSGDVSGTLSSNSVVSVGGKTAAQISTSVNDTQAATASATADTIVKRNSSGDFYANAAKINYADIYRPSTSFNIRLQAPTSLSTNYVLNLPTTSGTTGQVLSTDGSGNLSWVNSSTGSVVSVSATAPLASTGGSTPMISITQATTSTNGYLSSADWNTFNNKQAATSAAIIATLGYTPADNSVSGTYAQKANNLSDLTNVATARTNLGLGTFATASTVDLGSASATGVLAIARLPSFTGDATVAAASNTIILSNSGVTAGTYNKVTVDSKGRVTSSSALASGDVTTALGYTPASASAATQWTTSGADIYYNTGKVGIGITNPSYALEVSGSARVSKSLFVGNAPSSWSGDPVVFNGSASRGSLTLLHSTVGQSQATNGLDLALVFGNADINLRESGYMRFMTSGTEQVRITSTGNVGIGTTTPSAKLHLAAGTASIAPLKLTSGTLLTSPQSGTMEYDGTDFYLTNNTGVRRFIATGSLDGTYDNVNQLTSTGNISMVPVGSVIVSSTTASTNSNTGALVVKGGLGVAGNINTAGNLNVSGSQVVDGSLKISSMTSGSVLFAGASGTVTQDNSSLFWDGGNKRLGIGTTSPTGGKLHVSGGDIFLESGNKFVVNGNSGGNNYLWSPNVASPRLGIFAGGIEKISVNYSDGNVGIGTTSPSYPLDVQSSSAFQARLFHSSNNQYDGSALMMSRTRGTLAANTAVTSGDTIGGIYFRAHDGAGTGTTNSSVEVSAGENHSGTNRGTYMIFETTTNGSASRSEKMRIHSNGNVGIGTMTPAYVLSVYRAAAGVTTNIESGSSGSVVQNRYAGLNSAGSSRVWGSGVNISDGNGGYEIYDYTAGASRFLVNASGTVGIGTTSPALTLDVSGAVRSRSVAVATTVTSIDWSAGNIQYTPDSCGAFTFNNIADGAAYTFVVKGATSATCTFTLYSGNGSGALTAHFTPANAATTAATHTAYTFFRAGNDVYISWTSGL